MQEDILDTIEFLRECLYQAINKDLTNLHDNEVVNINRKLNEIAVLYIRQQNDKDT